jgi:hypothetical protein
MRLRYCPDLQRMSSIGAQWLELIRELVAPCMTASALSILFFCVFFEKHSGDLPWWGFGCQGRRTLSFILTLDTRILTFTIGLG